MRYLLLTLLLLSLLQAKLLISPFDALHAVYGKDVKIEKKNVLLTMDKAAVVYKQAKMTSFIHNRSFFIKFFVTIALFCLYVDKF